MDYQALKKLHPPDAPGVYRFIGATNETLYVGKATSLRDRVRSYFANDLMHTRGKHIVDMVTSAKTVQFTKTDSVLDAVILEASLIKKYQPKGNTKEKDDKSWNHVVITREKFPRVLIIRERTMLMTTEDAKRMYKYVFGPFPQGTNLKEAVKIVRRIFPFRDACKPAEAGQPEQGKPCFNRQIGLCPGVCTGEITVAEYAKRIMEIKLFFEGKKSTLLRSLTASMNAHAKVLEFEKAQEYKKMIFALRHIKDVSLINEEVRQSSRKSAGARRKAFRIEAYDIAHISGKYTVGAMTVTLDGRPENKEYRKFKIRIDPNHADDTLHLEEVLKRRFTHTEWTQPDLVVVDGGVAQKRRGDAVLRSLGLTIPVVSVLKDDRHKAKAILGNREIAESYKKGILTANLEAHRFAVLYHRELRDKIKK